MEMNAFKINGIEYRAKELDFNALCAFEDMGVNVRDARKKPLSLTRAYMAYCMECNLEDAGRAMNKYVADGGDMEDLVSAMVSGMGNAGFFQENAQIQEMGKNIQPTKMGEKRKHNTKHYGNTTKANYTRNVQ